MSYEKVMTVRATLAYVLIVPCRAFTGFIIAFTSNVTCVHMSAPLFLPSADILSCFHEKQKMWDLVAGPLAAQLLLTVLLPCQKKVPNPTETNLFITG